MGWTEYRAEHYKKGKVDRKAELDPMYTQEEHDVLLDGKTVHYPEYKVLKSAMVGSTYYAAVQITNTVEGFSKVRAAVVLTSVDSKRYFNFAYKDMSEDMGPYCYDCPIGILKLLTETDNEVALEWRAKCWEKHKKKNSPTSKANLPVGSIIEFEWGDEVKRLQKCAPCYQFRRPWWKVIGEPHYFAIKRIPDDFTIIKIGGS